MSRLQDLALQRLCSRQETLKRARDLLRTAKLKTGPGTGYDLREGASGLHAICAYLASEELDNADVTDKVAQIASCLSVKVWTSTVKVVRSALEAAFAQQDEEAAPLAYEDLVKENKLGKPVFVTGCLKDVERSLFATGLLPDDLRPPCDTLRVSVFIWTCQKLLKLSKITPEKLLNDYELPRRDYDDIVEILNTSCQEVTQKIRAKVEELRIKSNAQRGAESASQPAAPPTKASSLSPVKLTSQTTVPESSRSPTKTPTHKRKVAFVQLDDVDMDLLDTPSKRPKITLAPRATPAAAPASASPSKSARVAGTELPPLPALSTTTKASIFPSVRVSSSRSPLELLEKRSGSQALAAARASPPEPESQTQTLAIGQSQTQGRPVRALAPRPAAVAGSSTSQRRIRDTHSHTQATPHQLAPASTPATPTSTSHSPTRRQASRIAAMYAEEEAPRPRRFRPVFIDQRQWFQRDPKVEREWKMAEKMRRKGHFQGSTMDGAQVVAPMR